VVLLLLQVKVMLVVMVVLLLTAVVEVAVAQEALAQLAVLVQVVQVVMVVLVLILIHLGLLLHQLVLADTSLVVVEEVPQVTQTLEELVVLEVAQMVLLDWPVHLPLELQTLVVEEEAVEAETQTQAQQVVQVLSLLDTQYKENKWHITQK
jgi:hypothetical protein